MTTLHSAHDLGTHIRDLRSDARAVGITITDDWCRDQMHALGLTRYEDVDDDALVTIADRVDTIAGRYADLCAELSRYDDGTGDLGIIVAQALRDDPDATAADIATIIHGARTDNEMEN